MSTRRKSIPPPPSRSPRPPCEIGAEQPSDAGFVGGEDAARLRRSPCSVGSSECWQTFHAFTEGDVPLDAPSASIVFANMLSRFDAEENGDEQERHASEPRMEGAYWYGTEEPSSLDSQAQAPEPPPPMGSTDSAPEAQTQKDDADAANLHREDRHAEQSSPLASFASRAGRS